MINRVTLILAEWRSTQSGRPARKESPDEHIESTAISKAARETFPLNVLSLRIDSLKLQHRATLLLRLWPLQSLPDSWREKYLPAILNAGVENGLTTPEVRQHLEQVMAKRKSVSEDGLLEVETRRGLHFESERHFDLQKRARFGRLRRLEESGEYLPESGTKAVAKHDCYEAVKKSAEASVLAMFAAEDVFSRAATGIRKVRNPNWFRRSFCKSCYKQKYHRRIWLNARLELLNMKPENGPMSHADIGMVLNCPENTSYSNLSRATKALQEPGGSDALSVPLERVASDDVKDQKDKLRLEREDLHLNEVVCEDLRPSAG